MLQFFSDYGSLISIILFAITDIMVWFRTRKSKSEKQDSESLQKFTEALDAFTQLLSNKPEEKK